MTEPIPTSQIDEESEYICALSGLQPSPEQKAFADDELEDLPLGWSKCSIQTRITNPKYDLLINVKQTILGEMLSQLPEDMAQDQKNLAHQALALQVDAQFAALQAQTPPFIVIERICFLSDPSKDEQVKEEWDSFLERLDIDDEAPDASV